jgi:hypothetical protein
MKSPWWTSACLAVAIGLSVPAYGLDLTDSLKPAKVELKSAGPLAFGPDGVLFVADPIGACVYAIDTGDKVSESSQLTVNLQGINEKLAAKIGVSSKDARIIDMAVNPGSRNVYFSISRGQGPDATAVILRVNPNGSAIDVVNLENVKSAQSSLPNAPSPEAKDRRGNLQRMETITDMAFLDGRLFLAGLSNEEFASKLRSIPFPFDKADAGSSVEIFHGAHGQFETRSPVRTFVPYTIDSVPSIVAAYQCTPLVKFSVGELTGGTKVKGTTIAELGNMNRPLDMIVYKKDGKDYILMANTDRGVMKIATDGFGKAEGITTKIDGKAGVGYETIEQLKDVVHLDTLDSSHALLLVQNSTSGRADLKTIELP